jgi:hypothetical protein
MKRNTAAATPLLLDFSGTNRERFWHSETRHSVKVDESADEMARARGEASCFVVTDAFYPGHTQRAIAVVERAEAARELAIPTMPWVSSIRG